MFRFLHHQHRHHAMHGDHHHHRGGGRGRGPKMFDAGAMRYVVLHLIAEKPRHGYEIIKALEQLSGGGYTPSPGAIYPLLSMMLDMGHVSATADGNKKLHTITPEGEAFLAENRQFVDVILARLAEPSEGRVDLRLAMHELKAAVIDKAHGPGASDQRAAQIRAILQRAVDDVRQLD
ncbi:PadR family transcriptional regulator [Duganella sp. BJB488]|uniref:PadR family transcriptional regulator n=1 Tax=unclassified Duganella TaxID=2636909 RepID=UPI000E353E3A|nr:MULTISPECIES: PadR family transcriptional regulator [unclassified Duganella]RFP26067.1 PadR family transcriptional regulator [Duganella sp. BJB489]RFP28193.1 PadR family transcriptional regulator [Duganella sp. BJB488]RFP36997.1 PadR family transcriptional regulator [Duganella sp. BJB480]